MTDSEFERRVKRFLDRMAQVVGDEMVRKPGDPDPLSVAPSRDQPPPRSLYEIHQIGEKTREVLHFCRERLAAGHGFPTTNEIAEHMRWPAVCAQSLTKNAIARLLRAGLLSRSDIGGRA